MHRGPLQCALAAVFTLAAVTSPATAQTVASSGLLPIAEARRADLAQFRTAFLAVDRSYSDAARREAEQRLASLAAEVGTVSAAYFELELARIVALADNGHTGAFPGQRATRYNRVAIRLVPFGEDFYVLRAEKSHADLLGARLTAIDTRPISELRALARTLSGGTAAWRDRHAGFLLESPEQLHALGAILQPDTASYHFQLPDGSSTARRLAGERNAVSRVTAGAVRWLYPGPLAVEQDRWTPLLRPGQAPWAFQDGGTPFRWRHAAELDAVVIDLRQNRGNAEHPLDQFQRTVAAEVRRLAPHHLVLDLRLNGGGDLNTTRDFMRLLPMLVPGRVVVLTSPWTFSAAISSVGYLEQSAPDRVTIVGEMAGDRLEFWAEGRGFPLSHTGIIVQPATERHDYRNGCRDYPDCHRSVVRQPISVPTLAPDIAAPWTIEAYRAGRDPGMEAVAAALARPTP